MQPLSPPRLPPQDLGTHPAPVTAWMSVNKGTTAAFEQIPEGLGGPYGSQEGRIGSKQDPGKGGGIGVGLVLLQGLLVKP